MGNGGGCAEGGFHRMEAVRETVIPYRLLFTNSWGGRFWKYTKLASELLDSSVISFSLRDTLNTLNTILTLTAEDSCVKFTLKSEDQEIEIYMCYIVLLAKSVWVSLCVLSWHTHPLSGYSAFFFFFLFCRSPHWGK